MKMIWIVIVLTLQLPDSAVSRVRIVGIVFNDLGGTDVFHRASYRKRLLEEDLICMPLSLSSMDISGYWHTIIYQNNNSNHDFFELFTNIYI